MLPGEPADADHAAAAGIRPAPLPLPPPLPPEGQAVELLLGGLALLDRVVQPHAGQDVEAGAGVPLGLHVEAGEVALVLELEAHARAG